jgi:amino acid transporter
MVFAGLASPLVVLVMGLIMLTIATSYRRLNAWMPHAGAPYAWLGRIVNPQVGYATGILAILASFMANLGNITLFGTYALGVISPGTNFPGVLVWFVSMAMMAVVIWLAILGVRPSIRVQIGLFIVEYAIVILFVVLALARELTGAAHAVSVPSIHDFFTFGPAGFAGFAGAAVAAGFMYGGWEAPLIFGEETRKRRVNPGRAAIMGVGFITIWLTFLTIVFQGVASQKDVVAHGADVFGYVGALLLPGAWGRLMSIAVLLSVFAVTQSQLMEQSRLAFAMGRDKLLPMFLEKVSPTFHTPWAATLVLGLLPPILLIPYLVSAGAAATIGYLVGAAGLLYIAMYAIIGFACVRFQAGRFASLNLQQVVFSVVLPGIGALLLVVLLVYGAKQQSPQIAAVTYGLYALCIVAAVIATVTIRAPYFLRKGSFTAAAVTGASEVESDTATEES